MLARINEIALMIALYAVTGTILVVGSVALSSGTEGMSVALVPAGVAVLSGLIWAVTLIAENRRRHAAN